MFVCHNLHQIVKCTQCCFHSNCATWNTYLLILNMFYSRLNCIILAHFWPLSTFLALMRLWCKWQHCKFESNFVVVLEICSVEWGVCHIAASYLLCLMRVIVKIFYGHCWSPTATSALTFHHLSHVTLLVMQQLDWQLWFAIDGQL